MVFQPWILSFYGKFSARLWILQFYLRRGLDHCSATSDKCLLGSRELI